MEKLDKKKILIYGFGLSGKSCFNFLKENNFIKIYDDSDQNIPKKYHRFFINKKNLIKKNFDNIVISPGINIYKCQIKEYLKRNKKK